MASNFCLICNKPLITKLQSWHRACEQCGYEKSTLEPQINSTQTQYVIDEAAREQGLRELREDNFTSLLEEILKSKPSGGTLLEVGCAHGWFLRLAQTSFNVLGIEPDEYIYEARLKNTLPVRHGYFPDVLADNEKFDVIVFNDVFEHIPDAVNALRSCCEHLNVGGILVINLPDSDGFFYRASKILSRVRVPNFFSRMWQVGLPSPHIHYFNRKVLTRFLEQSGFDVIQAGHLHSVRLSGLFSRVSYTKTTQSRWLSILIYVGIVLSLPILRLLPGDILYVIATPTKRI
jgi:2-polyprenyl-3-methyl-5-hydroxy-6-metoxy-1,4-benzoquinol methylase